MDATTRLWLALGGQFPKAGDPSFLVRMGTQNGLPPSPALGHRQHLFPELLLLPVDLFEGGGKPFGVSV